jgi:flagellar motor switch protein FliM
LDFQKQNRPQDQKPGQSFRKPPTAEKGAAGAPPGPPAASKGLFKPRKPVDKKESLPEESPFRKRAEGSETPEPPGHRPAPRDNRQVPQRAAQQSEAAQASLKAQQDAANRKQVQAARQQQKSTPPEERKEVPRQQQATRQPENTGGRGLPPSDKRKQSPQDDEYSRSKFKYQESDDESEPDFHDINSDVDEILNEYSSSDIQQADLDELDELEEELSDERPSVDELLNQLTSSKLMDKTRPKALDKASPRRETASRERNPLMESQSRNAQLAVRGLSEKLEEKPRIQSRPKTQPARPFDSPGGNVGSGGMTPASMKRASFPTAGKPSSSLKRPPVMERDDDKKKRKAQPYDWGKTAKLTQDQKKFLERVFKQYADYVTTKMASILQTRITLEFQSIKLRPYSNFTQSLYEPITMIVTRMDPEYQGLIVIDFPLSFALLDRCLGGKGEPLDEIRYFTEIETAIFERITSKLIESYQESWNEIKECKPQFAGMEFNPQTVHILKPSDMMVCIYFDVRLSHTQGPLYVALPFDYLKNILPKANFEEFMLTRTSQPQVTPTVAPLFAKNIEQAKVPVSIDLGASELLFQDLLILEVGDLIILDQEISKALRIKVNDKVKFLGFPGVRNNKLAAQITKVLQEGDEEFEE